MFSQFQSKIKVRGNGNDVPSTVLKIEPIGFQHNMQIERGYQTAISDFGFFFFKNLEIGKNKKRCFPKFYKKILRFQKTEYVWKHTVEYVYKISRRI